MKTALASSERVQKEQARQTSIQLARANNERAAMEAQLQAESDRAQRLQAELATAKEPDETLVVSLPTEHVHALEDQELARLEDLIRNE